MDFYSSQKERVLRSGKSTTEPYRPRLSLDEIVGALPKMGGINIKNLCRRLGISANTLKAIRKYTDFNAEIEEYKPIGNEIWFRRRQPKGGES